VHSKAGRVAVELHSEVPLNGTEVVGAEILMKVSLELSNRLSITTCKKYVIHIHKEGNGVSADMSIIEVRVRV